MPARRKRLGSDEGGQLMMLAGIVLTISFILTSLTLSQVSSLERAASGQESSPLLGEWRFMHARLESNLRTAIDPETTVTAATGTILPTIAATFRAVQAEKGYDLVIRAAGGADYAATGNEASLVTAGSYNAWSYDGGTRFDNAEDSTPTDGLIVEAPCPYDGSGSCIAGVYLYVRLADATTSIGESILFSVNQP